jgi:hypothetical protein
MSLNLVRRRQEGSDEMNESEGGLTSEGYERILDQLICYLYIITPCGGTY